MVNKGGEGKYEFGWMIWFDGIYIVRSLMVVFFVQGENKGFFVIFLI